MKSYPPCVVANFVHDDVVDAQSMASYIQHLVGFADVIVMIEIFDIARESLPLGQIVTWVWICVVNSVQETQPWLNCSF